jgi:two-component system LytT family response regulator
MKRKSEKPIPPRLRAVLVDDEPLARIHLATRLKAHPEIEIVGEADGVPSAFALVRSEKPDVIFLDIQMPKKNGFAFLPLLEKVNPQPVVVFVTAFDEYAIRAFEANALDYLTKPVSQERLAKTITRLIKKEERTQLKSSNEGQRPGSEDLVLLREGTLSMMVKLREIAAIESEGDYTKILLADEEGKERRVLMKQTLSSWEIQFPAELFSKVSRSLLVNTKAISRLVKRNPTTWELQFQGLKTPITLSNLESKRLREVLQKSQTHS